MRRLYFIFLFTVILLLVGCESPIDIQLHELDLVAGSDFNRSLLKNGDDFSVGYENGNIRTSQVSLSWSQSTEAEFIFYKLMRDDNELAVFTNQNKTTFTDTMVVENNFYDYQIVVFADDGMVAKDTISIKTPRWDPPSNLTANGLSTTDVKLMWNDNSDSEDNFKIYLFDNTRSLIDSFMVDANVTEKIVTDLYSWQYYYFTVKAVNQWEEDTEWADEEGFDMNDFYLIDPSGLNCQQNLDMSVTLDWDDNSTLETGYSIERKINSGEFEVLENVDTVNLETYTDIDTLAYEIGYTLTYRVRAYNDYEYPTEYTDYSNEYSLVIQEISPGNITITLQVDSFPSEASWNVVDLYNGNYYFAENQTFDYDFQTVTENLQLAEGWYAVICWDSYGDGGISGEVWQEGLLLEQWDDNDYSSYGEFDFYVGN